LRSIFLFLIVIVVFLLVMAVIRSRQQKKFEQQRAQKKTQQNAQGNEKMVCCEICQTYLPESQALCVEGKCFCSKKHLQQFVDNE